MTLSGVHFKVFSVGVQHCGDPTCLKFYWLLIMSSKQVLYYENWVMKKEGVKTWVSYLGLIRGKWLQFYEKPSAGDKLELRKTLELLPKTQCSLVKRTKRRFPFSINNGVGTYYIKCETEIERYHWIFSILSASLGKPKQPLPEHIPESLLEKEAFSKKTRESDRPASPKSSPTKSTSSSNASPTKQSSNMPAYPNKRREKYALRNERRAKRKTEKKARKLGLPPLKSNDELRRTQNVRKELRRCESVDLLQERDNTKETHSKIQYLTKDMVEKWNLEEQDRSKTLRNKHRPNTTESKKFRPHSAIEVRAMINPKMKGFFEGDNNLGYDGDDDSLQHIPVQLNDNNQLLPNMIISEHPADSDSDESLNTTNTSLASGSFISPSASLTSRTFLAADDEKCEQQMSPRTRKLRTRPISPARVNPGKSTLMPQNILMDRPISPAFHRPLTPKKSPAHFSRFMVNTTVSNA